MAKRRMFSKDIIDTDVFLEMPATTQVLYFHLSMRADDDGFVSNPKRILRLTGCSEDDLKLLFGKKFILPFESGVCVIRHWRIHNYIQKDRYNKTIYREELEQLSISSSGTYEKVDTKCIQNGYRMDTQVRLELGKSKVSKGNKDTLVDTTREVNEIFEIFNSICPSLPKPSKLTQSRKKLISSRINEYSKDEVINILKKIEESDFLTGRKTEWRADIDWVFKAGNFLKIVEGKYANIEKAYKPTPGDFQGSMTEEEMRAYDM